MIRPIVDIAALRSQLDAEIDVALQTSEHLGLTVVSCHLQMARDLLGEPILLKGPRPDAIESDSAK